MVRIILGVLVALLAIPVALSGETIAASAIPLMGIVALLLIAYGISAVKAKRNPEPRHKPPPKSKQKNLPHMPPPAELDRYTTDSGAPPPARPKPKPEPPSPKPAAVPARTTTCRDCKMMVSRKAKSCPHCGAKDPATSTGEKVLAGLLGAGLLIVLLVVCADIDLPELASETADLFDDTPTTRRTTTTRPPATTTTLLSLEHQLLAFDLAVEACTTSAEFPDIVSPFEAGAMILVIWQADKPPMDKTTEDRLVNAIGVEIRSLCPELIP